MQGIFLFWLESSSRELLYRLESTGILTPLSAFGIAQNRELSRMKQGINTQVSGNYILPGAHFRPFLLWTAGQKCRLVESVP